MRCKKDLLLELLTIGGAVRSGVGWGGRVGVRVGASWGVVAESGGGRRWHSGDGWVRGRGRGEDGGVAVRPGSKVGEGGMVAGRRARGGKEARPAAYSQAAEGGGGSEAFRCEAGGGEAGAVVGEEAVGMRATRAGRRWWGRGEAVVGQQGCPLGANTMGEACTEARLARGEAVTRRQGVGEAGEGVVPGCRGLKGQGRRWWPGCGRAGVRASVVRPRARPARHVVGGWGWGQHGVAVRGDESGRLCVAAGVAVMVGWWWGWPSVATGVGSSVSLWTIGRPIVGRSWCGGGPAVVVGGLGRGPAVEASVVVAVARSANRGVAGRGGVVRGGNSPGGGGGGGWMSVAVGVFLRAVVAIGGGRDGGVAVEMAVRGGGGGVVRVVPVAGCRGGGGYPWQLKWLFMPWLPTGGGRDGGVAVGVAVRSGGGGVVRVMVADWGAHRGPSMVWWQPDGRGGWPWWPIVGGRPWWRWSWSGWSSMAVGVSRPWRWRGGGGRQMTGTRVGLAGAVAVTGVVAWQVRREGGGGRVRAEGQGQERRRDGGRGRSDDRDGWRGGGGMAGASGWGQEQQREGGGESVSLADREAHRGPSVVWWRPGGRGRWPWWPTVGGPVVVALVVVAVACGGWPWWRGLSMAMGVVVRVVVADRGLP
nr:hypothetical protein [Tanacetum cinerariifolium]